MKISFILAIAILVIIIAVVIFFVWTSKTASTPINTTTTTIVQASNSGKLNSTQINALNNGLDNINQSQDYDPTPTGNVSILNAT